MRYNDVVRYLSGNGAAPLPEVPGEAGALFAQGEDRLRAQDRRGALRLYRRALELEPENPTLLMSYALLCLELDRTQEIEADAPTIRPRSNSRGPVSIVPADGEVLSRRDNSARSRPATELSTAARVQRSRPSRAAIIASAVNDRESRLSPSARAV
jgi:hypothetical protein